MGTGPLFGMSFFATGMIQLEIGRGMPNPGGIGKGYEGVGVRVYIFIPSSYPYPHGGYEGYRRVKGG